MYPPKWQSSLSNTEINDRKLLAVEELKAKSVVELKKMINSEVWSTGYDCLMCNKHHFLKPPNNQCLECGRKSIKKQDWFLDALWLSVVANISDEDLWLLGMPDWFFKLRDLKHKYKYKKMLERRQYVFEPITSPDDWEVTFKCRVMFEPKKKDGSH